MTLGQHIRGVRLRQGRTLADIGAAAGVTKSLMSKIETGKTSPPVATLMRIAAALGMSVAALIEEGRARGTVHAPGGAVKLTPTEKGYAFAALAAQRVGKLMEPYLFEARRGQVKPSPLRHPGEEWVYVLTGRMRYRVGATVYLLGPGDSLYFDASDDHDFEPVTATVRFLGVFCAAAAPAMRPTARRSRNAQPKV